MRAIERTSLRAAAVVLGSAVAAEAATPAAGVIIKPVAIDGATRQALGRAYGVPIQPGGCW